MDLTNQQFVEELKEALRCGMTESLRHYRSLKDVDVAGVERTLYPMLRQAALQYLEARGYFYLTDHPNFIVIGETTIAGTQKRADGFICDPENGSPVYAIEVGIGGSGKFWSDYRKSVNEWARTGIKGVFIILFDTGTRESKFYELDSSTLKTPKNNEFNIFPLILPTDPSFDNAMKSYTCFQYQNRHSDMACHMLTISDRDNVEIHRWTTDLIAPVLEEQDKLLINQIHAPGSLGFYDLEEILAEKNPKIIIAQAYESPFNGFTQEMGKLLGRHIEKNESILVIIGDWIDAANWEKCPVLSKYLPVKPIGLGQRDVSWETKVSFGKDITVGKSCWLDLASIDNSEHYVRGFVKSKKKRGQEITIEMKAKVGNIAYPFIVSDKNKRVIWLASGVGGWGKDWYRKYQDGYRVFWREVIKKIL